MTTDGGRSEEQKRRRLEKFMYLKRIGYSNTEATRMRDWSGDRIDHEISMDVRRIRGKSPGTRTDREREILDRSQQFRSMEIEHRKRIYSDTDRLEQYREWSRTRDFPPDALNLIRRFNTNAGETRNSSFGYRMFYHLYVNRATIDEAEQRIRENDT